MARIPTELDRNTRRTQFDSLGAVGTGGGTDFSALIKGASSLLEDGVEFAVEKKLQSEVDTAVQNSKADVAAGESAKTAKTEEESFADIDDDEFSIADRGNVAAGRAFDSTLRELSSVDGASPTVTTDPQLASEFAEIGKMFNASSQGRLPANVFNTRLASRVTALRARFPHHNRDINSFITSKMGFDPVKRELARAAKIEASQIRLQEAGIKQVNDVIFANPDLDSPDPATRQRNVARFMQQQSNLNLRKQQMEMTNLDLKTKSSLQKQQGNQVVLDYTSLVGQNVFNTVASAIGTGQDVNQLLLQKNTQVVELVSRGRLAVQSRLNRAGVLDPDARKTALDAYDNEMAALTSMFKHKDFVSIAENWNKAVLQDDVARMTAGEDGLVFRKLQALTEVLQGAPMWSNLMGMFTQTWLKKPELIRQLAEGKLNPASNMFNSVVQPVPRKTDDPKEERTLRNTGIVAGAKFAGGVRDVPPEVTNASIANITSRTPDIITDKDALVETARAITSPNYIQRAVKRNITTDQIVDMRRITSAHMLNLHHSLKSKEDIAIKPTFRFDDSGKIKVAFNRNVRDNATRGDNLEASAMRALQPTINEADRVMEGYLAWSEAQGFDRQTVIAQIQDLGPFQRLDEDPDEAVFDIAGTSPSVDKPQAPKQAAQRVEPDPADNINIDDLIGIGDAGEGDLFQLKETSRAIDNIMRGIDSSRVSSGSSQMGEDLRAIKDRIAKVVEGFTEEGITQDRVGSFIEGIKEEQQALVSSIMEGEGLRLKTYKDSRGHDTIGYGHKLLPGESFPNGITEEQAQELLKKDLQIAEQGAKSFDFFKGLNRARKNVVQEMVFNLGKEGFTEFGDTIAAIESKDWNTAADEMLNSDWAKQVGSRANRLADQMRSGEVSEEGIFDGIKDTVKDTLGDVSFNPVSSAQASELEEDAKNAEVKESSVATKSLSTSTIAKIIPQNVRFLFNYVTGNTDRINEESVTEDVRDVIRKAVANAKKDGRTSVEYKDYPNLANGISPLELATWQSNSKQAKRYPKNLEGFKNIVVDSYDPVMAASMSLGKFSFTEQDGQLIVTDQYDLVKSKSKKNDLFSVIRDMSPAAMKAIPIRLAIDKKNKSK